MTASSNGIYVDDTPPEITNFYYLDVTWDMFPEPSFYQSNNHTIAANWVAHDNETRVGILPGDFAYNDPVFRDILFF